MGLTRTFLPDQGYLGPTPMTDTYRYKVVGDRVEEYRTVVVFRFNIGDVEDPDLYAAEPLWNWQNSEQGKWVMENAEETPIWHRDSNYSNFGYNYAITAKLRGARLTEWLLRYDSKTTTV